MPALVMAKYETHILDTAKNNIIAQQTRAVIAPVNEHQAGTVDLMNAPLTNDINDIATIYPINVEKWSGPAIEKAKPDDTNTPEIPAKRQLRIFTVLS
ncbi:hypothetical protein [Shewanella algae]|uniref:hypothetical protein n=1 Tax=Shewanella algae TaxID=38313 RepID=UPI001AB01B33|nr:hypothetical protein [Shewanella algae]MBO2621398.1 hypothetical protein [Shewanella algae]